MRSTTGRQKTTIAPRSVDGAARSSDGNLYLYPGRAGATLGPRVLIGAGLGRWGMAAGYFGTASLPGIWAEIQVTGWVVDGGILMLIVRLEIRKIRSVSAISRRS